MPDPTRHQHSKATLASWLKLSLAAICSLGLLAIFSLAGCATSAPPVNPGAASYTTNNLIEGDVISINFQYSTNFNTVQKIGLDGKLNLTGVGQVTAANKTTTQLETELTSLYKDQVKDDPVTVKIVTAESVVYVAGAVMHPGKVSLDRPLTVLEAVMEAGGYDTDRADLSNVMVLRLENGEQKCYRVNLKRILAGHDPTPFYLRPFDVVQVATKVFNL